MSADLSLLVGATAFGVIGGIAAGTYCAAKRGTVVAVALEGAAAFFIFAPLYVLGLSLILLFGADIAYVDIGVHIPRAYVPFGVSPLRLGRVAGRAVDPHRAAARRAACCG